MEDLVGEENVDWGLLRRAVPFQTPTNVVEGLEHDFLELLGSRRHDVDQEACATRRDTDSVFVGLGDQDSRGLVFLHFSGWSGGRSGRGAHRRGPRHHTVVVSDAYERDSSHSHRVIRGSPNRDGVVPPRFGRRVVLVPGSSDATLQSIQGTPSSLVGNRFAVLADEDPLTGEGQKEFAVATRAESGLSDHGTDSSRPSEDVACGRTVSASFTGHHIPAPPQSVVDALEFGLTRGESSGLNLSVTIQVTNMPTSFSMKIAP